MEARKIVLIVFLICVLIVIAVIVPNYQQSYIVEGPCRLLPRREWSITHPQPEVFVAKHIVYNPPSVESVRLFQFDRPDFVTLTLNPEKKPGMRVSSQDTIGTIESSDNTFRFEELYGDLQTAKAMLAMAQTGEKASIREEAERALEYAKSEIASFEPILKRKRELNKRELVSDDELDIAEAQHRLLSVNVSIAEARVKSAETGVKEKEQDMFKSQITDFETQLNSLRGKMASMAICPPFSGILLGQTGQDSLCTVVDLDTLVAQFPVEERQLQYLSTGLPVSILIPAAGNKRYISTIFSIDRNPITILGRTFFTVRVNLANPRLELNAGMTGRAAVHCDTVDTFSIIRRWWRDSSGMPRF